MAEWGTPQHRLNAKNGQYHRYEKADLHSIKDALNHRSHLHMERDALINGLNRASAETARRIDSEIARVDAEIARIDEFIINNDADLRAEIDEIKMRLDEHDISISQHNVLIDNLTDRIDGMMARSANDWFSDVSLAKRRRNHNKQ